MNASVNYRPNGRVAYSDVGDRAGRPILVQHGLIASIDDSHLFERLIASGRRVISIARPGYGESSPYEMDSLAEWGAIVESLADALGLATFDVLGLSSGAPYSYSVASHLPDRVGQVFIFSGMPALYDEQVLALWPYPVDRTADLAQLKKLAAELFFAGVSDESEVDNGVRDSMQNGGFGVAQDLKLRYADWGFALSSVAAPVFMEHGRHDDQVPVATAIRTASLLPNCRLAIREHGEHFSPDLLDDFIRTTMLR